jgi:hypothetical protein
MTLISFVPILILLAMFITGLILVKTLVITDDNDSDYFETPPTPQLQDIDYLEWRYCAAFDEEGHVYVEEVVPQLAQFIGVYARYKDGLAYHLVDLPLTERHAIHEALTTFNMISEKINTGQATLVYPPPISVTNATLSHLNV